MPEVGERRTRKDGQAYAEWNGSVWVERPLGPAGTKPRAEYGAGAYETPDGAILKPGKSGNVQVLRGAQTAAAEARTRLELGFDPIFAAQKQMERAERGGVNPYNRDWGARMAEAIPFDGGAAARVIGGDDYQRYEQANRTFESAILPIFSGAAVTESEAKRFVRANLPQIGDTPQTLAAKSKNRQRLINAAARLTGREQPYPEVDAWNPGGDSGASEDKRRMGPTNRRMAEDAKRSRQPATGGGGATVRVGNQTYTVREKP